MNLDQFTGHTAGEWELLGRTVFPKGSRALCVAIAEQHRKECSANARLIAAAPDLLAYAKRLEAALRVASGLISTMPAQQHKHPQDVYDWMIKEAAALEHPHD